MQRCNKAAVATVNVREKGHIVIFVRDGGAPWDLFTIGAYRDLKHYAESADVPPAKSEEAARAAGFDGAKGIGPYLRTLISLHHDTLAVAVR